MVISIGAGRAAAQYLGLGHFTYKQHMASQILLAQNLAGKHCVCILRYIQKTVMASFHSGEFCEFVDLSAGLHTKMPDGLKGNIFRQHTDIKNACVFDHFPCQIAYLDRDRQLCGVVSYLKAGIGDAAVVFVRFPGAENKQSIGHLK